MSSKALSLSALTLCSGLIWSSHSPTLIGSPLVSIGENGALFFNGSTQAIYNDNIFLDSSGKTDDFIFNLSPGLELNFTDGVTFNVVAFARQNFFFYADNSGLDYSATSLDGRATYQDELLDASVTAGYSQTRQNTPDINVPGQQIRQEILSFDAQGEYRLSDLFSVGTGFSVVDRSFKERGFRDRTVFSVPVDVFYRITPLLDLSGGYRFRYSDNNDPITGDTTDHLFNVGLRGEIAPMLTGRVFAGYQIREFDRISSIDGVSFGTQLGYQVTPLLSTSLTVERDFRLGARGDTIELTSGRLGAQFQATDFLVLNSAFSYSYYDYKEGGSAGREDDFITFSLGGDYLINSYSQVSLNYRFQDNDSNRSVADFTNNTVSVSATFRY